MANLAQNLLDTAAKAGDATALRMDRTALTYGEFLGAARHVAAGLQARGIGPGDRVGLLLPNVLSFPVVFYGALMAGAAVVPMNPLLTAREIGHHLADSGARLVAAVAPSAPSAPPVAEAAEAAAAVGIEAVTVDPRSPQQLMADDAVPTFPVERADDDTAVILYTSGTTGPPEGAELTHGGLHRNALTTLETLLAATPDDVIMGCLPLFHVMGLTCSLNAGLLAGACLTLLPRFDGGTALGMVERERVSVFEGVPTMYSAMLHAPDRDRFDVSSLRLCVSGGSAMPVEVMRAFEDAFGCIVRPIPAEREEVASR